MTRREVFGDNEIRQMLREAVERARATTRGNMADEAVVEHVFRRYLRRGSVLVEVSTAPPMETR